MGMDVVGLAPTNEAGRYYRASVWSWFPIWDRLVTLCGDFLDEKLLCAMSCNNGAGPEDQETCNKIVERFEGWMGQDSSEKFCRLSDQSNLRVTLQGRFVSDEELKKDPHLPTRSPYSVHRSHVEEFVQFLKNCGGFAVC